MYYYFSKTCDALTSTICAEARLVTEHSSESYYASTVRFVGCPSHCPYEHMTDFFSESSEETTSSEQSLTIHDISVLTTVETENK
jgi:hypothetical protein